MGNFSSSFTVREQLREQTKQYEKSENDLKALQSVGQVSSILIKEKERIPFASNRFKNFIMICAYLLTFAFRCIILLDTFVTIIQIYI